MLWLLAVAVGIVLGAVSHQWATARRLGAVVRAAAAVAGFLVGFFAVYIVAAHV